SVPDVCPWLSVTVPGWVSVLPVPLALSVTAAPATVRPSASRTVTVMVETLVPALGGMVAGTASTDDAPAPGGPTSAVAVNETGSPVRGSPVVALRVLAPGVGPRRHGTEASPFTSVITGCGAVMLPPPAVTENVTGTAYTPFPCASVTRTAGGTATSS